MSGICFVAFVLLLTLHLLHVGEVGQAWGELIETGDCVRLPSEGLVFRIHSRWNYNPYFITQIYICVSHY